MDRSLDEIIKESRAAPKNPFTATVDGTQGKAPGGKNGKKFGKDGGGVKESGDRVKDALMKAVNQNSKAKRAAKANAARGMDVDMTAPAPNALAKARRGGGSGKGGGGKGSGFKMAVGKAAGAVGKAMNTLKARMAAGVQAAGQSVFGRAQVTPGDIKITIPGAANVARAPGGGGGDRGGGKGSGKGSGKKSPGRSPGRSPGGIVQPGMQLSGGAIKKQNAFQKMRTVVFQGAAPGGSGSKAPLLGKGVAKGGRGRGGKGKGGLKGLMARAGR